MNLHSIPKALRYIMVGTLVAFTYQLSFMCVKSLPLPLANLIAVCLTSLVSYFGHHSITFLRKGNHQKYGLRFSVQFVITYLTSTAILHTILTRNIHYFYGIALVWVLLPITGFIVMQLWTFMEPHSIDLEIKQQRYRWPKSFTPLSAAHQKASDDFMKYWHTVLPNQYSIVEKFNHQFPLISIPKSEKIHTLEIGAGLGEHLAFEKLTNQEYYCLELRKQMGEEIQKRYPDVNLIIGDCQQKLDTPSAFFDRILAIHVLEHLPNLPAAVEEMHRLIKPTGTFSVVIPCDPGLAYGLGRKISAERLFKKQYDIPYKPIIRREHINAPAEVLHCLKKHFTIEKKTHFPLKIPSTQLNLCIGLHLSPIS